MNWHQGAGLVSGLLAIGGMRLYICGIMRGEVQPNRATWWSWTVITATMTAGSIAAGAVSAAILPGCLAVGDAVISLLSIKYGVGGWSKRDRICIVIVLASLLSWHITANPNLAVLGTVVANLAGFWPTLAKIRLTGCFLFMASLSITWLSTGFASNMIRSSRVPTANPAVGPPPSYSRELELVAG